MSNPWAVLATLVATFLFGWAAALAWRGRQIDAIAGTDASTVASADAANALREARAAAERAERERAAAVGRAEAAERRYQQALTGSQDGVWEWRLSPERVQLSPRWKGMLGYGADEIADARSAWLERVHADDRGAFTRALEAAVAGGDVRFESELRLVHRDGSVRHVLSRALVVRGEQGQAERVVGLDTDVTRLKRVQAVLDAVADGTSGAHGERFFSAMAEHFARALQVDFAFITECADQPPTRVRTLAAWSAREGVQPAFEYDLAGTPCEEVIHGARTCFYPQGLSRRFANEPDWEAYVGLPIVASDGRVLGHLALLDKARLGDEVLVDRVYRIFLARAAAEMERLQALARLAVVGDGAHKGS